MRPGSPTGGIDGTDEVGGSGARAKGKDASASDTSGKRPHSPRSSSGKYPLPRPWPDPEDMPPTLMIESEAAVLMTEDLAAVAPVIPMIEGVTVAPAIEGVVIVPTVTPQIVPASAPPRAAPQIVSEPLPPRRAPQVVAAPAPPRKAPEPAPPRKARQAAPKPAAPGTARGVEARVTRKVTRDLALESASARVTQELWLPKQDYWLANHQVIPRPSMRKVPRPQRFRPVSRRRSMLLLVIIVLGTGLIGAGVVFAATLSYQYFNVSGSNAPGSAPKGQPVTATSTIVPATTTATTISATVTTTVAEGTAPASDAQGTVTPELPTVTP
ncbi:MAG TPA: hypothetical protein VF040_11140 [Ktedonobacterales bacterium]